MGTELRRRRLSLSGTHTIDQEIEIIKREQREILSATGITVKGIGWLTGFDRRFEYVEARIRRHGNRTIKAVESEGREIGRKKKSEQSPINF